MLIWDELKPRVSPPVRMLVCALYFLLSIIEFVYLVTPAYIQMNIYSISEYINLLSKNIYLLSNNIYLLSENIYSLSDDIYLLSENECGLFINIHYSVSLQRKSFCNVRSLVIFIHLSFNCLFLTITSFKRSLLGFIYFSFLLFVNP